MSTTEDGTTSTSRRSNHVSLPSERFHSAEETITVTEWQRRQQATYRSGAET